MFHKLKSQASAALLLCAISALPMQCFANETTTITADATQPLDKTSYSRQEIAFDAFRHETKTKISETRQWVKGKKIPRKYEYMMDDLERATDRLQDRVSPAGWSFKSSLKEKFPGAGIVRLTDRTVTVFGLMLIIAFALVVLLLSLSRPASRLGGRH